jgi:hypothetical protein
MKADRGGFLEFEEPGFEVGDALAANHRLDRDSFESFLQGPVARGQLRARHLRVVFSVASRWDSRRDNCSKPRS